MKIGIVGLPNVGKSTLFNALTKSKSAMAANYPFCTIDPNVGVVEVPDSRLQKLVELVHPQKTIPAIVEFVDIAGLVKGASEGSASAMPSPRWCGSSATVTLSTSTATLIPNATWKYLKRS